jgi:hypothetical protein
VRCLASLGAFGTRRVVMTVGSRGGKQEPGLVCRQGCYQPDEQLQSRRDRRGVCDRARHGLVFDRTHEQGPLVLDGMRGHRLGVRDIGEMPSRSRSSGHTTAGNDGRPGSGSVSQAWSVDVDVISQSRRANRAGTGSASVTVHGAGMGIVRHTAKGRTGHTGCEGTDWQSETSVRCRVGHGSGLSREW